MPASGSAAESQRSARRPFYLVCPSTKPVTDNHQDAHSNLPDLRMDSIPIFHSTNSVIHGLLALTQLLLRPTARPIIFSPPSRHLLYPPGPGPAPLLLTLHILLLPHHAQLAQYHIGILSHQLSAPRSHLLLSGCTAEQPLCVQGHMHLQHAATLFENVLSQHNHAAWMHNMQIKCGTEAG